MRAKFFFSKATLLSIIVGFAIGYNLLSVLRISGEVFAFLSDFRTSATSPSHTSPTETSRVLSTTDGFTNESITLQSHLMDEYRNLYSKQRVLCWIMTSPRNHGTKAKAVKDTWGKRCDLTQTLSPENALHYEDEDLPTIRLDVTEGRDQLWGKTREGLRYIWNLYQNEVDWFFKADDDTFAVVENLRYFLTSFNTSLPYWFGHRFKYDDTSPDFFSGGAGYVLSKEALRRFVDFGYSNGTICRQDHGTSAEDVELSRCLKNLDVAFMDTRDSKGKGRFFPLIPGMYMSQSALKPGDWFLEANYYPPFEPGLGCCSDTAISFHYIEPDQMHLLNYLIYKLQHHGAKRVTRPPTPEPPPDLYLKATPYWQMRRKNESTF